MTLPKICHQHMYMVRVTMIGVAAHIGQLSLMCSCRGRYDQKHLFPPAGSGVGAADAAANSKATATVRAPSLYRFCFLKASLQECLLQERNA